MPISNMYSIYRQQSKKTDHAITGRILQCQHWQSLSTFPISRQTTAGVNTGERGAVIGGPGSHVTPGEGVTLAPTSNRDSATFNELKQND